MYSYDVVINTFHGQAVEIPTIGPVHVTAKFAFRLRVSIKLGKSLGSGGLHTRLLSSVADTISEPLTVSVQHIFFQNSIL